MRTTRDLWWKDIRIGQVTIQTTADFHSLFTNVEFALVAGLGTQAAGDAMVKILEAKGK